MGGDWYWWVLNIMLLLEIGKFLEDGMFVTIYAIAMWTGLVEWDMVSQVLAYLGLGSDGLFLVEAYLYPVDSIRDLIKAFADSAHFDATN